MLNLTTIKYLVICVVVAIAFWQGYEMGYDKGERKCEKQAFIAKDKALENTKEVFNNIETFKEVIKKNEETQADCKIILNTSINHCLK